METQTVINIAFGLLGALMGGILKAVWDGVKDLQTADKALAKDVGALQVLVAGDYIKRESFDTLSSAIFAKLDKIEAKLDRKMDKADCDRVHGQ